MTLSAKEQATLNFYQWEYQGRGYALFDTLVDSEVFYQAFQHYHHVPPVIDDGRTPSWFTKLTKGYTSNKQEVLNDPLELEPIVLDHKEIPNLVGYTMSFPFGEDISPQVVTELVNMLTQTNDTVSFEMVGTEQHITISIVCSQRDRSKVTSLVKAYFPRITLTEISIHLSHFDQNRTIALCDFGLKYEFICPLQITQSFSIDPLTPIIAVLDSLRQGDSAMLQIMFKGASAPWSYDIPYAVSDGRGGSFFVDAPDILNHAKEKVSQPLFSVVMRIATQSVSDSKSQTLAQELIQAVVNTSRSSCNSLIPLSNKGYAYEDHIDNLYMRMSNRCGMILNSKELATFVHYPNKTIVSAKLYRRGNKTKLLPSVCMNQQYVLGVNNHEGREHHVSISDDTYRKHIVISGATGTGKSHLLKQLIYQDIQYNNSAFVIDPHGDLVSDVLSSVPKDKQDNVIYINLADEDYAFGFNIFNTETEAEKTVLASDLATAFSNTWISSGDRIQSVLQKTISTFVYTKKEVSLLDMKRFLLEEKVRFELLESLEDPVLLYYWHHEFPLVRRHELSPLLLRIDSFMQTRLLRNIFCQTNGVDISELVHQRKIVLIQLSVGLIGLQNSIFLAHLIISKINQLAFSRQNLFHDQRLPIHLYIDESHNYANTPVIEQILSGARKYNLGLVLTLQHLEQVSNTLLNSILSNTATQIFFRQSDKDSKRVAPSFSSFESHDFMALERGKAIVRVNTRSNDFNMQTLALEQSDTDVSVVSHIIESSRKTYAKTKEEIHDLLATILPQQKRLQPQQKKSKIEEERATNTPIEKQKEDIDDKVVFDKESYVKKEEEQVSLRKHRSLQEYVKTMAQQRGFVARIEEEIINVGRVDVGLTQNNIRIAVEVSVTNSIDYEVRNIQKCLSAGYDLVFMISESEVHRNNIQKKVKKDINSKSFEKTCYLHPRELSTYLDMFFENKKEKSTKVKGWRVNVNYNQEDTSTQKYQAIKRSVLRAINKKK